MLCHHDWVLLAETYANPVPPGTTLSWATEDVVREALFGATSFLWQCSKCKATRTEKLLGERVTLSNQTRGEG